MGISGLAIAVATTAVAGIAIGALVAVVLIPRKRRPPLPPPPPPPPQAEWGARQMATLPLPQPMHGFPMQATMQAMPSMAQSMGGGVPGGHDHGAPVAGFALQGTQQQGGRQQQAWHDHGMPVAGFALQGTQQQGGRQQPDAHAQQAQRQFEAEFENTVPSMEDLIRLREESDVAGLNVTPSEVLEMLNQGNVRFWTGQSRRPELNAMQRREEIWQSYPKVAIIGCSDSRVPPEIIFDLELGDVFVVRVAGNAYGTGVGGSIHYAVTHLHVKLVLVLGHEGCGIVRHSQMPLDALDKEPDELGGWLRSVRCGIGIDLASLNEIQDNRAQDREAVIRNVLYQVRLIRSKVHVARKVGTGELLVVGAFYEKRSGMVDFIRCEAEAPAVYLRAGRAEEEATIVSPQQRAAAAAAEGL